MQNAFESTQKGEDGRGRSARTMWEKMSRVIRFRFELTPLDQVQPWGSDHDHLHWFALTDGAYLARTPVTDWSAVRAG
ncbi:MAG TPA: DUF5984 family protein, partial [Micromonosporaceae bacterium]